MDERFRIAAEFAPCALVMVNQAGEIVFVNAQAEPLFGYQRDELMGRSIEVLLPEAARRKHVNQRTVFFSEPQAARHMGAERDLSCVRKDGSECPVEIGLTQIETSEGRLVLSSIVDITERRRLERQLEERNREISRTQALAVVGRMANMVAHDLRNPLSSIKMGLQILGKKPAPHSGAEEQELKQIALEQVRYMEGILVDLLDYSREVSIEARMAGHRQDVGCRDTHRAEEYRGTRGACDDRLPIRIADSARRRRQAASGVFQPSHQCRAGHRAHPGLHGGYPRIHPPGAGIGSATDSRRDQ